MDAEASPEDAALARMTPVISHEIRNPLAIIGNSSYFIKAKLAAAGEVDPKVARHLQIIEAEIKHANATLEEILLYARMREPKPAARDLNALAEEALAGLTPPEGAEVRRELSAEKIPISVDAELVTLALRHLARNALEALTLAANRLLTVTTGVAAGVAFAEFSDTGPGVPAEALARLFIPFTTTKPRGIGLGLAFARKALRRHHGELALVPGARGARFRATLPLKAS